MDKKPTPFFKRLEINWPIFSKKTRFRLARTTFPKPSLSWHPLRGFSLNTTHGARVSKTFKGITIGFQNLSFVFRGRWSFSFFGLNVNASKSGFSLSQTNLLGTYNFSNPNRSSANILGIQLRGKKAANWAFLGLIISFPLHLVKLIVFIFQIVFVILRVLTLLIIWFLQLLWAVKLFVFFLVWHITIGFCCIITPESWFSGK